MNPLNFDHSVKINNNSNFPKSATSSNHRVGDAIAVAIMYNGSEISRNETLASAQAAATKTSDSSNLTDYVDRLFTHRENSNPADGLRQFNESELAYPNIVYLYRKVRPTERRGVI